jgi:hypothetical protein
MQAATERGDSEIQPKGLALLVIFLLPGTGTRMEKPRSGYFADPGTGIWIPPEMVCGMVRQTTERIISV